MTTRSDEIERTERAIREDGDPRAVPVTALCRCCGDDIPAAGRTLCSPCIMAGCHPTYACAVPFGAVAR